MMTLHSPATEETMRNAIDRWKRWKLKTGRKQSGQNVKVVAPLPAGADVETGGEE
jgi:hypothetical protein